MVLQILATLALLAAPQVSPWAGVWTYDTCHEDRMPGHTPRSKCREGQDRIVITVDGSGTWDVRGCSADPRGERGVTSVDGGRGLKFRTPEGFDVRLILGEDRAHYRGRFRGAMGHNGRIWGRRVAGCN